MQGVSLGVNTLYIFDTITQSLCYHDLIGRWGASMKAKETGITGSVTLSDHNLGQFWSTT